MTKAELMKKFEELQKEKNCRIEGIYWNSRKDQIQNAIDCLKCFSAGLISATCAIL